MVSRNDYDVPLSAREEALGFMRSALDTEYSKQLTDIENESRTLARVVEAWPNHYDAYNSAWALLELLPETPTP
jgi:hypothetical protein